MDFFIKKGTDEFRELVNDKGHNFKNNDFYILITDQGIKGYVDFTIKENYIVIDDITTTIEDEKLYDALLRAVAFYGAERLIRYVVYSGEDTGEKNRMRKSIFSHTETDESINKIFKKEGINLSKGISVDSIELFSAPCEGSKMDSSNNESEKSNE